MRLDFDAAFAKWLFMMLVFVAARAGSMAWQ